MLIKNQSNVCLYALMQIPLCKKLRHMQLIIIMFASKNAHCHILLTCLQNVVYLIVQTHTTTMCQTILVNYADLFVCPVQHTMPAQHV